MTQRKNLQKVEFGKMHSPFLMKAVEHVSREVKIFFGGKVGYKRRMVAFFEETIRNQGEARAVLELGYDWLTFEDLKQRDSVFSGLLAQQKMALVQAAEETLYHRGMMGYEETVEEDGVIVKRTKKYSDRALMEYLKANHPKYNKKEGVLEEEEPEIEIKTFSEKGEQ